MKLDDYRKKRDQTRTNEPFGNEPLSLAAPTWQGAFVVHLHRATRRHYDLRIEVSGVLASFAVPKGPSLNPQDKRLAVRTEDHPLEYLDFEAVIPAGNYGAGPMILWDRGRIRFLEVSAEEGLARGKLEFEAAGYKLRGVYLLVRSKRAPNEWLLIKKADAFASSSRDLIVEEPRSVLSGLTVEELSDAAQRASQLQAEAVAQGAAALAADAAIFDRAISPMLCASAGALLGDPAWLYELKLDGVRLIAKKHQQTVSLTGRKGHDMTATYPEITRAMQALAAQSVVLDGEVIALDETGQPNFQRLAQRIHLKRDADVRMTMLEVPVIYVVFDMLALGECDLRQLPLLTRKALLAKLIAGTGIVRALDFIEDDGQPLLAFCEQRGLEGIIAKQKQSPYQEGPTRGGEWVKIKCERDDDFVIVGFTKGEGNRARLGAIDVASYEGDKLVYRGKVGSGIDDKSVDLLRSQLEPYKTDIQVAEGTYSKAPRGRTHVQPRQVASVRYLGFSEDGHIRFGVFRGLRDDVHPEECTAHSKTQHDVSTARNNEMAQRQGGSRDEQSIDTAMNSSTKGHTTSSKPKKESPPKHVAITNPDKVLWPKDGYTKTDLCDYYEAVADVMLPYLKNRPVLLVRYPDGIEGKHFYQWNVPLGTPSWIRTARVKPGDRHDAVDGFLVNDPSTLRYIANLGAIAIHILAGRFSHLEESDFLTIDFDVKQASLDVAIPLAQTLHEVLDVLGLVGFPKTSGQSGLHVLVPLGPGISHQTARTMADLLGKLIVQRHRDTATMERFIANRGQRVYVDTGQTGRSRAIVAPYSLRAQPLATVSAPLLWDEVVMGLDVARFNLKTVPQRCATIPDPMAKLLGSQPDLSQAVQALEALIKE